MNYSAVNQRIKMSDIIIVMLVLINSGYALTSGNNTLLLLLLAALTVALLYKQKFCMNIPRNDPKLIVLLLMAISMVLSFLVNWDFGAVKVYVHTALFILNGYLIRLVYTGKQIVNAFIKVLLIGAIAALSVAVVDAVIPISSFAPTFVNGAGNKYYTFGIVSYQAETYFIGKRCCGLFWEPGMFSGMLALAAMLDIYTYRDKRQKWRIVLYCAAIFITFSTSGYVYFIMLFLMILVRNKKNENSIILLLILGIAVALFSPLLQELITRLADLLPHVFEKVINKNKSYQTRVLSPLTDVLLMIRHPFGTGFTDFSRMRLSLMEQMGTKTSITTSTLTYFGTTSGILFFIVYNFSWIRGFLAARKMLPLKLLSILIYVLVLSSNPMFNNQLIWAFVFMEFPDVAESIESRL